MLQSNSGPPPPISNPDGLFRQQLTSNGPAHQQPHQPSNGGAFHSQLPSNSPAPPQPQYPPNISHIPPPPPFGFSAHGAPFREPQHSHVPQQQVQAMAMPTPRHFVAAPPSQHPPTFSAHGPSIHHRFTPDSNTRPYQRTGDRDPQFAPPPQFPGVHGPTIPPASKLPLPKLTPHALGLLNAFKNPEKPAQVQAPPSQPSQSAYTTPRMQPAPALHRDVESFASASAVSSANPYAPSPPPFQSPAASANLQQAQPQLMGAQQPFQSPTANLNMQPAQPKPMSSHHDSLLNLFRSPSAAAATPPANSRLEPVELSAQPHTPGDTQLPSVSGGAARPISDTSKKPNGSATNGAANQQYDLTSATVSGPVNVPDFETVKKHAHVDGHSRGPSPAQPKDAQNKPFVPQILKRDPGKPKSPAEMGVSKKPAAVAPTPPKPMQILKRPSRGTAPVPTPIATRPLRSSVPPEKRALVPADGPVHAPSVPKTTADAPKFDKRDVLPTDQKNALLSLFGKPAISAASPVPPPKPNMPPQVLSKAPSGLVSLLSKSPLPKSPQPATPKSVVSGIISPVSPLPDKGSQVNSPAQLASRSRISSIGDGTLPGITASDEGRVPVDAAHAQSPPGATRSNGHANLEEGYKSTDTAASSQRSILAAPEKKKEPATSPMDASFLRGFLEDVARRGR
jgi:mRNA-decapping enzyme subunit 2